MSQSAPSVPDRFHHSLDPLFAAIAAGLVLFDLAGEPIHCNPTAIDLFLGTETTNTAADELATLAACKALLADSSACDQISVACALAGNTTETVETTWRRCNGELLLINVRLAPLRDKTAGQIVGAIAVISDVTKWQRLDQTKDEFISTASHELQAPLTSLMLISRLIERRAAKPELLTDFALLAQDISRHAKRMSRLVSDMLSLARINSHRFSIYTESCDLVKIVSDTIAEQQLYWQRAISLHTDVASLSVMVDAERIWQVLTNLLSNAAKFSSTNQPIAVSLVVVADGASSCVRISIQDQGVGIAPERLPHLFDAYYRVADDEPEALLLRRDGLGLGLYIARAIIEGHQGRIWVESTVGVGSTFTLELPLLGAE